MATEKDILKVLDLLTAAPPAQIESLPSDATNHYDNMNRLIGSDNIIAVGISEKISQREPTGKLALTFYVSEKIPQEELKAIDAIPPTVPEALSGKVAIPTDVKVIGELVPEINATRDFFQPGNSIGHYSITAGTFGALVTDGKSVLLLSNSHVLAASGTGKKGDEILYPGPTDTGVSPTDLRARLHKFVAFIPGGEMVNFVDAALAVPESGHLPSLISEIKGIGLPKGTIKPKRGMKVIKVGRTTDKTEGEIVDINFRFVLDYRVPGFSKVGFKDQVLCSRYTAGGDSGSLVIDKQSGKAVGLHFAGAKGGSVFNPIHLVLESLGVKLVTTTMAKKLKVSNAKKN